MKKSQCRTCGKLERCAYQLLLSGCVGFPATTATPGEGTHSIEMRKHMKILNVIEMGNEGRNGSSYMCLQHLNGPCSMLNIT